MRITQNYNLLLKELIVAAELQFDLNQLFTVINSIDKDNLARPGSVFDWGNTKLNNVNDPLGEIGDSTDLQVAVTKNWLKDKLFAAGKFFDPANGNWHLHTNKATIDLITSAGDGAIPSAAERARFLSQAERDAMTAANAPSGSNAIATMADIGAPGSDYNLQFYDYGWNPAASTGGQGADAGNVDMQVKNTFSGTVRAATSYSPTEEDIGIGVIWDGTNMWLSKGATGGLILSDTNQFGDFIQVMPPATPILLVNSVAGKFSVYISRAYGSPPAFGVFMVNTHTGFVMAKIDLFGMHT
jgi:hypothetical protein